MLDRVDACLPATATIGIDLASGPDIHAVGTWLDGAFAPCVDIRGLTASTCHWPVWRHEDRPVDGGWYCGRPSGGQTYCPHHAGLAAGAPPRPLRTISHAESGSMPARLVRREPDAAADLDALFDGEREVRPRRPKALPIGRTVNLKAEALRFHAWRAGKNSTGGSVPAVNEVVGGVAGACSAIIMRREPDVNASENGVPAGETVVREDDEVAVPDPVSSSTKRGCQSVTAGETAPTSAAQLLTHYAEVRRRLTRAAGGATDAPADAPQSGAPGGTNAPPPGGGDDVPRETSVRVASVFADIVTSACNDVAVSAARAFAEGRLPGGMLYLYGPQASGKTRLLMAAVAGYAGDEVRMLDDVETASPHRLAALARQGLPVMITGKVPPAELERDVARVLARMVVVPTGEPDAALRRGVALAEMRTLRLDLEDGTLATLLDAGLDLHQQAGVLRTLAMTRAGEGGITPERLATTIKALHGTGVVARRVRIDDVIRTVCEHYDVSRIDLLSQRRTQSLVKPRQVAMFIAKQLTLRSLPEIGRRFGGRDHTTVLHATSKIGELCRLDATYAAEVDGIASKVKREAGL